jgi:hypothetical protein
MKLKKGMIKDGGVQVIPHPCVPSPACIIGQTVIFLDWRGEKGVSIKAAQC